MSAGWVLVTRAEDDLGSFRDVLVPAGFAVFGLPVLRQAAVVDDGAWRLVERSLGRVRMVAFTSSRAPAPFANAARRRGLDGALASLPAAAVGEATALAATACGFAVVAVGAGGGLDLARLLAARCERGSIVLHPCSREHRGELGEALAAEDVQVLAVVVYAMEPAPPAALPELPHGAPAAVVLTSPRAAEAYAAACGRRLAAAPHFVLGATSAARASELGIDAVTLRRPSPAAVLEELCRNKS